MAVSYIRLFKMMEARNMSNVQLQRSAGFSLNIVTRLKRNQYVSLDSIEKVFRVMDCSVDEILEFIAEEPITEKQVAHLHNERPECYSPKNSSQWSRT